MGRFATNMKDEQEEKKDMTDKEKDEEYDLLPYFHWPTGSFVLANQNLRYNIGNFLLRPVQICIRHSRANCCFQPVFPATFQTVQ